MRLRHDRLVSKMEGETAGERDKLCNGTHLSRYVDDTTAEPDFAYCKQAFLDR